MSSNQSSWPVPTRSPLSPLLLLLNQTRNNVSFPSTVVNFQDDDNVNSFVHANSNLTTAEIVESIVGDQISESSKTPTLKFVHDYLLVILLVSVMFSMGCSVTVKQVLDHLRRPTAVLVCIAAQFFLVPFVGYCLIVFLHLEVLHATGLLILACCPGGVTSNIFTYMCDGDLSLSITMTSVATIAALLLMPLNVWLYGRNLETGSLVIPYMEMSVTLILVTIPVLIGMALNWRYPKYTPYITKVGVFAGFGIICFCQSLEIYIFPDIFVGVPPQMYAAVFLLPFISFFAGTFFAKVCCLNEKVCRTIGIEIGIKNVGSALTIVSLSFSIQQLKKAWVFPFLYAFSSFLVIFLVTLGYKFLVSFKNRGRIPIKNESDNDSGDYCNNNNCNGKNNKCDNHSETDSEEMQIVKEKLLLGKGNSTTTNDII